MGLLLSTPELMTVDAHERSCPRGLAISVHCPIDDCHMSRSWVTCRSRQVRVSVCDLCREHDRRAAEAAKEEEERRTKLRQQQLQRAKQAAAAKAAASVQGQGGAQGGA